MASGGEFERGLVQVARAAGVVSFLPRGLQAAEQGGERAGERQEDDRQGHIQPSVWKSGDRLARAGVTPTGAKDSHDLIEQGQRNGAAWTQRRDQVAERNTARARDWSRPPRSAG